MRMCMDMWVSCLCVCVFMRVHKLCGESPVTDVNCRSCWHIQSRLSTVMEKRTLIDICCVCSCVSTPVHACVKHSSVWVRQMGRENLPFTSDKCWIYLIKAACVFACLYVHTLTHGSMCYTCVICFLLFFLMTPTNNRSHSWSKSPGAAEERLVTHCLTSDSSRHHSGCILLYHAVCSQLIAL